MRALAVPFFSLTLFLSECMTARVPPVTEYAAAPKNHAMQAAVRVLEAVANH